MFYLNAVTSGGMAYRLCRPFWSKCHFLKRAWPYKGQRTLLSAAYTCDDAWKQRLDSPLLQKVDAGDFAMLMYDKFEKEGQAASVDIDILANTLDRLDSEQLDFVQTIFHKYRHTQEALKMQTSTPYAFVRTLLAKGEGDRLLEILKDKVEYGIFLDFHLANVLLDHFIETKQYKEAAEIAYEQMLQEDFDHPITWLLSWYACHLHWQNPPVPVVEEKEMVGDETRAEDEEEEEELEWIRVNFLEHPFYDDHFDIPKDSMKLGKTFTMVAKSTEDVLGRSYQLMGWGLYEKFDRGIELMRQWLKNGMVGDAVSRDAVDVFINTLENLETREHPTEEKEIGMMTMEDVYPYVTKEMKDELLQQTQEIVTKLESAGKITVDYDLGAEILSRLKTVISEQEGKDIEKQHALFKHWNNRRQELVDQQIEDLKKHKKREDLAKRLVALQQKEEKLRYFEQQDKIKIGISRKKYEKPIEDIQEEEMFVLPPGERGKGY